MARSPYHPAADELFWAVTCTYRDVEKNIMEEIVYVHEDRHILIQHTWDDCVSKWANRFPVGEALDVEIDLKTAWRDLTEQSSQKDYIHERFYPSNGLHGPIKQTVYSTQCTYQDILKNEELDMEISWPQHVLHTIYAPTNIDTVADRSNNLGDLLLTPRNQRTVALSSS